MTMQLPAKSSDAPEFDEVAIEALARFLPTEDDVRVPLGDGLTLELGTGERRVRVCTQDGAAIVEVLVTPSGPIVSLRGTRVRIDATEELLLAGRDVRLEARQRLELVAGEVEERVKRDRTVHVEGTDRLEAGAIERQASAGSVSIKAEARVAIDGSTIGLNDDPCPAPFAWSDRAKGLAE
ncbi:MAG: hypothetical protein HOW73_12520 [Polyangiaceae bacterium]|nr:hypothetical protein [Polyangiaceae bacterium]